MVKEYLKSFTPQVVKNIYHKMIIFRDNFYIAYHQFKRRYNKASKLVIVFLVQRTEVWNSVKTVYEAAKKCQDVETYIIAIPPNKSGEIMLDDESTFMFCRNISDTAIKAYDIENQSFFDIRSLKPSHIFLNVPYTDEYPACYGIQNLAKICPICYVPYGYTLLEGGLQSVNLRRELLSNIEYIFCDNKITERYCRKNLFVTKVLGKEVVYNFGFPRFDLYRNLPIKSGRQVNVLWIPRWTTENERKKGNEPSSFFLFKDEIINFFSKAPNITLTIRPHPRAFPNYIKSGLMSKEEVEDFRKKIDLTPNILLDQEVSYYESLINADILIADFSSLLAEFFITGRPIVYFGNGDNFSKENKEIYESFYHVESWKDAYQILMKLIHGDDENAITRKIAITHFMSEEKQNAGGKIVDFLTKNKE